MAKKDSVLVGNVYKNLTVIAPPDRPEGQPYWWATCRCVCGEEVRVRTNQIENYGSCGCQRGVHLRRHGLARHPLYSVWFDMKRRCEDPERRGYKDYGGRGIRVCERWQSVENFIADMEPSHQHGLELDRIDVNGNYEPANCRWVTIAEQAKNRRNVVLITHEGRTQTATDWAKEMGLKKETVLARIRVWGWSPIVAITTPAISADERCRRARSANNAIRNAAKTTS